MSGSDGPPQTGPDNSPQTVPAVLAQIAGQFPDHDALVAPGLTLTYAQFGGQRWIRRRRCRDARPWLGVPDERMGEVGKAFIVLRPGVTLTEQDVIAYTKEHLANFKTPRSVAFLDTLPRHPGGKVVKPQLREMNR